MKFNIRFKLIGPLVLIMLVATLMIVVLYFSLQNIKADEESRVSIFFEFDDLAQIKSSLARQDIPVHDYLINNDSANKIVYDRFVVETEKRINKVEKRFALNSREKKIMSRIKELQAQIRADAERIFSIPNPVGNETGVQLINDLDDKRDSAIAEVDKFQKIKEQEIEAGLPFHERLISTAQNNMLTSLLVIFIIFLIFIYLVTKYVSQPILVLHRGVEQMNAGNLGVRVELRTGDELQDLAEAFNVMTFNLNQEQQTAANIQHRLLPQQEPKVPGVNLYARQIQAKVVGGDWYDYYRIGDELFFLIADASGKGMPGALLSTVTMSTMRSEPKTKVSLTELVEKTNKTVVNNLGAGDFVTLFIAQLNSKKRELNYVNCGQEPPLIYLPDQDVWTSLATESGLPIGVSDKLFHAKTGIVKLPQDSRLILYTDGLHDVRDREGRFFAFKSIIDWLNRNKGLSMPAIIDGLLKQALDFSENQLMDDITLLGVEITK